MGGAEPVESEEAEEGEGEEEDEEEAELRREAEAALSAVNGLRAAVRAETRPGPASTLFNMLGMKLPKK